jgi:serine/threonine-protein kinase
MSDDPRVQQLLDELLDSHATPEQVCGACPELLPAVRKRWRLIHRLRADLDVLFPSADKPTPPPDWEALPQIPGYELETVLGRGGMGVVFKAQHLKLKRFVALKMMLAGTYASPEELVRFRRETEAIAALRHPHIVQVHDAGEVAGRPYFTMEYVEGGTLGQALSAKPLSPRHAAELLATLASAIQFAHRSGFIHRDIKPANVLLAVDGMAKVTDFGLARTIEAGPEVTQSGAPIGTPSYMAPEQAQGRASAVGPSADIYALGAVLYEMLTGQPPFEGESACETIHKVVTEEATPPSRLNPKIPRDLDTICLKCLQKEPARRYASAQDLADDLHRYLDGKPVRARRVGAVERGVKWTRRRPAAALLLTTLLVVSVVAAGTIVWLHEQEADRRVAKSKREEQARAAIETALGRATELRRDARWKEALVVLADAAPHLAEANAPELEQRLRQAWEDFRIADELESVRESYPLDPIGDVDYQRRAQEYVTAFEHVGLRIDGDAEPVAASIRASAIRDQLVAALEDRAFVAFMLKDAPLVEQLLRIARSADPGAPWRDRFRTPVVWGKVEHLQDLAASAFTSSPPPLEHQLALLGLLLAQPDARFFVVRATLDHSAQLLSEVCRRQSRNFWAQREMGFVMDQQGRYRDSVGYYRVALTLRPDNIGALQGLGWALYHDGQRDEALATYRRVLQISPKITVVRSRLVVALAEMGYWKEADAIRRAGLDIDPAEYHPSFRLAQELCEHGRYEEGVVLFRKVRELAPNHAQTQLFLADYCVRSGQHEDAVRGFRKAMELNEGFRVPFAPPLAGELATLGRWEEAIAVLQAAASHEPTNPTYLLEMGRIYRENGKREEAAKSFQKAVTVGPRHHVAWEGLVGALLELGRFAEARAAIESLLALPQNDAYRRAQQRQLTLCNALLAVDARLPAILAGTERPTDVPTQLALAEWCFKHKRLPATAADFYASVFSTQPSLAVDPEAGYRLNAARAAALAGCGVGSDAAKLDDAKCAALRKLALKGLMAEYNARAERHRVGKPGDRTVVATAVRAWLTSEDLAGVRDEAALAKLPAGEGRGWEALWAKVAALAARDPVALFKQARAHVARTDWKKAAECYAEGMELEPTDDGQLWFEYAAVQLLAGDRPGYCRACVHMLARGRAKPPMRAYLIARACTLSPDSTDQPKEPVRLFELEVGNNRVFWVLTERAALLVRDGRPGHPGRAVLSAEQSLRDDSRPGRAVLNWLWLALSYQKLGNPNEAKRWLEKAAYWLDQQGGRMPPQSSVMGSDLHNWLEAHVLRREAEALLR